MTPCASMLLLVAIVVGAIFLCTRVISSFLNQPRFYDSGSPLRVKYDPARYGTNNMVNLASMDVSLPGLGGGYNL